ncbi:hypothetical protein E2C01_066203 [Portunus trituberculatus]|uniref:Uncharacterized protein n=1 Tax=Portunus trituberculatus TaxID=210409 RepID=A0A5B7HGG7_PORTR|nr:hypothetical protein [Portunus trituberculatus]
MCQKSNKFTPKTLNPQCSGCCVRLKEEWLGTTPSLASFIISRTPVCLAIPRRVMGTDGGGTLAYWRQLESGTEE